MSRVKKWLQSGSLVHWERVWRFAVLGGGVVASVGLVLSLFPAVGVWQKVCVTGFAVTVAVVAFVMLADGSDRFTGSRKRVTLAAAVVLLVGVTATLTWALLPGYVAGPPRTVVNVLSALAFAWWLIPLVYRTSSTPVQRRVEPSRSGTPVQRLMWVLPYLSAGLWVAALVAPAGETLRWAAVLLIAGSDVFAGPLRRFGGADSGVGITESVSTSGEDDVDH